jgi:hypothetical protein
MKFESTGVHEGRENVDCSCCTMAMASSIWVWLQNFVSGILDSIYLQLARVIDLYV